MKLWRQVVEDITIQRQWFWCFSFFSSFIFFLLIAKIQNKTISFLSSRISWFFRFHFFCWRRAPAALSSTFFHSTHFFVLANEYVTVIIMWQLWKHANSRTCDSKLLLFFRLFYWWSACESSPFLSCTELQFNSRNNWKIFISLQLWRSECRFLIWFLVFRLSHLVFIQISTI